MPNIVNVRRNILLMISGAVVVAVLAFFLITPAVISLSPRTSQQEQTSFVIFAPILTVLLLAVIYAYLGPIHQVGRHLQRGEQPPADLAQQARTRAFSAPFYLFLLPLLSVTLAALAADIYGLIANPDYNFALHFSYSLLIIVTTTAIALILSSLSRRILRPVLVATADLAEDAGRRYEIRLRLAVVVLSLNFIVFYFLGVLAFNQVYRSAKKNLADQFRQWGHDVAQISPYLDDEALVTFVTASDILADQQAVVTLSDAAGNYLLAPSTNPPPLDAATPVQELVEQANGFSLTFPIQREDGTWHLAVTYNFLPSRALIVRNTLAVLVIFGAVILILTIVAVHYLANDITRDLKYVTARLLDIARRGHVGEKVSTLSLDEVGDLVQAFDKVRGAMSRQQDELNRRVEQMQQLHQASLALTRSVDFEQMLHRICQVARDITTSESVTLYLYDPEEDTFTRASQLGYDAPLGPVRHLRPEGMTRTILSSGQPILIPDTQADPQVSPRIIKQGIRAIIGVPVISRTQTMGVLYVNSQQANAYDDEDVQIVMALASQAAAAIENARLFDETVTSAQALEKRARNLLIINRISRDLASLLDPHSIFQATAKHLVQLMEIDHCGVLLFGEGTAEGQVIAEYPDIGTVGIRLPRADNPAIDHVLKTKRPLAVPDIHEEPLMAPVRKALDEIGIRAILIAPLIARDQVIGTLGLDVLNKPYEFSAEEQELCRTIAAQAAIAASNARLLYDLQQQRRALTQKSQSLAEESSKLDAVLSNMADGLIVTDLAGRIIVSNPSFKQIAGLSRGQSLRGRLLNETFSHAGLRKIIAEATGIPKQVATANLALPDGRVLKASASALRLQQGVDLLETEQVKGVVTLLRDITHEVEVDRLKTDFISTVSHELRTPLTSILGFANLIQREFRRRIAPFIAGDVKARRAANRILENLTIIEAESKRLTQLINDVLDIAKMEAGRVEWNMKDVEMIEVIDSAINATAILARERDLSLNTDLPSPLPPVWGDFDRLVQVMTNLLSNAIKFTEKGEVTVSCQVWAADQPPPAATLVPHAPQNLQPPLLITSVSDTGVGIASENIPLVFERFRQVGDTLTEKPTGTGLGLPICKEIIEHHDGAIWAESKKGVGSTFYFTLPLSSQQADPAKERPVRSLSKWPTRVAATTADESPVRRLTDAPLILIVDDEPNIRQLLRQELTDADYQVIEAADGEAALSQARLVQPDLIILDVMMPGVSGFGVTGALRADPDTTHIPIIILSVAEGASRALELGAEACLDKPVDLLRLLDTIEHLLASKEAKTDK